MSEPMIFVGREDERETIHRLIAERDKVVICIKGRSKMGKTHLVEKVRQEMAKRPHIYSTLHPFRSTQEDAIFPFISSLGELVRGAEAKEGAAPQNDFSVLRVNQELHNRSSLGAIYVQRDGDGSYGGIDEDLC